MRKFVISEEILVATLNYLNTRPRGEVNNLATAIEEYIAKQDTTEGEEKSEEVV